MGRLRKAPSMARRGRAAETSSETIQAGRSDSALNAEQNSAKLRTSTSSQVNTPSSESGQSLLDALSSQVSTDPIDRPPSGLVASLARRESYVPQFPSPLGSSLSTSSLSSNASHSSEVSALSSDSQIRQIPVTPQHVDLHTSIGSAPSRPITPMRELLRQNLVRNIRPENSSQVSSLGRSYSRYPAMGPESRRNSGITGPTRPSSTAYLLDMRSSAPSFPSTNPFSETTPKLENEKWGMVDDMSTFNPYSGAEKGFILYSNELEDDDDDHMPKDDDDIVFKPRFKDYFNRRAIISTVGAIFLIMGVFCLFIVLPVLYFTGVTRMQLPGVDYGYFPPAPLPPPPPPKGWDFVNDRNYSLLTAVRRGLIDPDTPDNAKIRKSTFDGADLNLVFSDEFNQNNRTFYPGDDPYWTAPNIWYGATQDMEWYDPDAVTTYGGALELRLDKFFNHNLLYRSGMLNSWNQLCFKGGVFEVSLSLPGPAGVPGLWPGVWSMGNLGRPGYKATTEGIWPYTYNTCDAGITPNQSSPDGISHLPGQKLPACTCPGEDHPSPGTGRGAPEIDILEASVDPTNKIGVITQSFQVAPFDVYYRPNSDFMQIPNYNTTSMNGYCGGPFQQAISATTLLNNNWYDGKQYQKYAFEYEPGTSDGQIAWFAGDDRSFMLDGRAIGPNGNVAARQVSEEPMAMVLNLGFSSAWTEILLDQLLFPTVMRVDYVRIYQRAGEESITCDPPGYETTDYIKNHAVAYNNPNLTAWNETGYKWPTHKLNTNC